MEEVVAVTRRIMENPDSIEIGTPSKGGCVKVYGDFSDPDAFIAKIDNAMLVKAHANNQLQP